MKLKKLFNKNTGIFLIVSLIILLTSCNNINDSSSLKNKEVTNINDIKDVVIEENYKEAFGDININIIKAELDEERPWAQLNISDKGEIFGFAPSNNGKDTETFIYDINSNKLETIYIAKDDYEPIFLEFNEDYLVWEEGISTESNMNSRLVIYDRKEKTSKILYNHDNISMAITDDYLALGNDYVLWSSGEADDNANTTEYKIYKYDIKSGNISIFKEEGVMPVIGNDFIAWLGPNSDRTQSEIYYNNLKDGSISSIPTEYNPIYLAASGDSLVYSEFDGNSKHKISVYENGIGKEIGTSNTDYFEFSDVSDNFISWRGTDKVRVYDKKLNKIVDVSDEFGAYATVYVSNKYIVWNSPVITDPQLGKKKAIDQGIYLSYLHIINIDDIEKK
ncbi:MAG: hypothetical protein ACERKV_08710 [Clostridiaceae bacterium]